MGMGADLPGHQHQPICIPSLGIGKSRQEFIARPDRVDTFAFNVNRAIVQDGLDIVKGKYGGVMDQHGLSSLFL
jgi:hypothetical protein